jgi:hypothetical protein
MMNERIRHLAKQSEFKVDWQHADVQAIKMARFEKFAELIIKECAQVSEDDITDGDACCTNTAYRISRQIKKHFGVE